MSTYTTMYVEKHYVNEEKGTDKWARFFPTMKVQMEINSPTNLYWRGRGFSLKVTMVTDEWVYLLHAFMATRDQFRITRDDYDRLLEKYETKVKHASR